MSTNIDDNAAFIAMLTSKALAVESAAAEIAAAKKAVASAKKRHGELVAEVDRLIKGLSRPMPLFDDTRESA